MRKFLLAAVAALALAPSLANAQALVQSAPQNLAAVGLYGQANGATSCNTVSQTAANDTITITPGPGQYVYVTELYIENTADATGITQTGTISVTNVNSSGGLAPFWNFGSALTTVQGVPAPQIEVFNPPLKSANPGTAVTFVPSATQSAHNYLCMHVAAYFAN